MQNNQVEKKLDERYLVKPLFKALQVLRIVCESSQALTLKDITELSEIPKSTVYRYLFTLTAMDMVDYNRLCCTNRLKGFML